MVYSVSCYTSYVNRLLMPLLQQRRLPSHSIYTSRTTERGNKMDSHSHHSHHDMVEAEATKVEYMKLAGVIIAIAIASFVLQATLGEPGLNDFFRWFMGVFFVVFASFKFVGYKMFAMMYAGYDVIAKRFMPYSYAYPFIELALGIAYLTDTFGMGRDIFTAILMGIGSIGVYHEMKRRSGIYCACLGNVIKLPLGTVSLIEDAGMGMMAIAMILMS